MAQANSDFAALLPQIRGAHHRYLTGPRVPTTLLPLNIADDLADWIRAQYKNAPKYLDLDWIKRARAEHDLVICPMCGGTGVATLEHVLPKADYPEFSVLSFNLVPSCDGCQRRRSNKGNQVEFVHPYFDHDLLAALRTVVRLTPPYSGVIFKLAVLGLAGPDLQRTQKHLAESVPPVLFRRHMKRLWGKWHRRFHEEGQADTLARINADLHAEELDAPNSWEASFLRGLSADSAAVAWLVGNPPT